jgi:hypothetical protein
MSAGASGVVDNPRKDEAKAVHAGCNLIVPGVVAKLAGEDLQGSLTRPTFVAQLKRKKKASDVLAQWTSEEKANPCPHPRTTDIR